MPRLVELPDRGRLILGTDLQGNLADFERLEAVFRAANAEAGGAVFVLTGDLVHGPEIPESYWPDYLGSFFRADSTELLARAHALVDEFPGRVFYLLGNHEHAHIGGPVVSKFFANEALRLERFLGPERTAVVKSWFMEWPLVAVARRAQLIMTHAAPNAPVQHPDDVERVCLDPPEGGENVVDEIVADLLWARTATTARAQAFMRAFDPDLRVAIYGHDVARSGHSIDREPLLCISSSFGCFDGDKTYLDWDLAEPAESARQVAALGLRPLYPDAEPIYRVARARRSAP